MRAAGNAVVLLVLCLFVPGLAAGEAAAQQRWINQQLGAPDRIRRGEQLRQGNPELFRQRRAQLKRENPELFKQRQAEFRKANPGLGQEQREAWLAEHRALRQRVVNLYDEGRYTEAESAAHQLLNRAVKDRGANHGTTFPGAFELGRINLRTGRVREAETFARRALAAAGARKGVLADGALSASLALLGSIHIQQDRYVEAEKLLKRAIAIFEKLPSAELPKFALGRKLRNLGICYHRQGRLAEAETTLARAVALQEQAMGKDHPETVRNIRHYAILLAQRGRAAEAESKLKDVIAVLEKSTGKDRSELAESLVALAGLYVDAGRDSDAASIFKRAIAAFEVAHGGESHLTAGAILGLGRLYVQSERVVEAEPLLRRSLAIYEARQGAMHRNTAASLSGIGRALTLRGQYPEALIVLQRALEIREKVLGVEHVLTASSLNNLGRLYTATSKRTEAEAAFKRALAINEKVLAPEHPDVARVLRGLGHVQLARGQTEVALATLRRASQIAASRTAATAGIGTSGFGNDIRPELRRDIHGLLAAAAWRRADQDPSLGAGLMSEALVAAQHVHTTGTGAAVSQMAARFATGSDALADLLRKGQDLTNRRQDLDKELSQGLGGAYSEEDLRSTPNDRKLLRRELERLAREIATINQRLLKEFPDYAALARATPVPINDIQALLGEDEALVAFLTQDKATYVWAVTRRAAKWHKVETGEDQLADDIARLRCGLEAEAWTEPASRARCIQLGLTQRSAELPPYDLETAHKLYRDLLAPLASTIRGKSLIIVPTGPLTSLSFHALVMQAPVVARPDFAGYRAADWLARHHALVVVPSVSSLKALRVTKRLAGAPKALVGFAAPVFTGGQQQVAGLATGPASPRVLRSPTGSLGSYYTGSRADLAALRQGLAPLPETEGEVRSVAQSLSAIEPAIFLGTAATEAAVKQARLADYRIVYFATHGLIAGEVSGLAEPALVLTLPNTASDADDGLLTASEVARLKLNADWVVLSACNTAAGSKPGAEALSGLARAFFYAGARALLVTHWRVDSEAAVKLATGTFEALAGNAEIGRSEALRAAMLKLIEADGFEAHPSYWAPFVVVGDNRTR